LLIWFGFWLDWLTGYFGVIGFGWLGASHACVDDRPGPCFGSLVSASHVCVCGVHPLFCQSADYGCDSVLTICVPVLRLSFCFELIVAVCVCVCDSGLLRWYCENWVFSYFGRVLLMVVFRWPIGGVFWTGYVYWFWFLNC
jgi:hypothetical protein